MSFWYAEEHPTRTDGAMLLDVRSPLEFAEWHLPGAVNIPQPLLRKRIDELPHDRPIFVYCLMGMRSYLTYRILKQRGFEEVHTLAGGSLTFRNYLPAG